MAQDEQPPPPKRKAIKLPSLKEVQAASKPVAAPDLFAARVRQPLFIPPSQAGPAAGAAAARQAPSSTSQPAPGSSAPQSQPDRPVAQSVPGASQSRLQPPSQPQPRPPPPQQQQQQRAQPQRSSAQPTQQQTQPHSSSAQHVSSCSHRQVNPNAILVSRRQEGNPLLKHIRNLHWQYDDIVPDYLLGANSCALFLSLRFHLLKPEYIHGRIRELQRAYALRVLLCFVDIDDVVLPLGQIIKTALLNGLTLICAWSPQECARYLETFKIFETKPADAIQGRSDEDYLSKLSSALTMVRGVNRTDVLTLGGTFQTAAGILQAGEEELRACPGIGPAKVRRLHETFHQPFRRTVQAPADVAEAVASQGKVPLVLSPTQLKAASQPAAEDSQPQSAAQGSQSQSAAGGSQSAADGSLQRPAAPKMTQVMLPDSENDEDDGDWAS